VPIPRTASAYERLDQSEGEVAHRIRVLMDRWFLRMPPCARGELGNRFRSQELGAHLGAFWELYVHEVSIRLGFDVTVYVGAHTDQERRPDFALVKADTEFRVEATAVLGDDSVDRKDRARVEQLYEAIEHIANRDFLLTVELRGIGSSTPGRALVRKIDSWLSTLDRDAEFARIRNGGTGTRTLLQHDGWRLGLIVSPIRDELRGREDFGGIGSIVEGFVTQQRETGMRKVSEIAPIAKALRDKAGHGYALDGKPFVIAALCAGTFASERDIAQALLGRIEHRVGGGGGYQGGGLWLDDRCQPRNTRVSAVLTALALSPDACAVVEPCLWTNPWARCPLCLDRLPWRRNQIRLNGTIETHLARLTVAQVLGLNSAWPVAE
jgi:hypothetical protein